MLKKFVASIFLAVSFYGAEAVPASRSPISARGLNSSGKEVWDAGMNYLDNIYDDRYNTVGGHGGSTRASVWYAIGLLSRNEGNDVSIAKNVISRAIDTQYTVNGTAWFGTYKKSFEDPIPDPVYFPPSIYDSYDPNWREFVGTAFILGIERYSDLLGDELVQRMIKSLELASEGTLNRNTLNGDNYETAYSNPAIMGSFLVHWTGMKTNNKNFTEAAEKEAEEIWKLFSWNDSYILSEYNAPTYYGIDLWGLSLWDEYGSKESSFSKYGGKIITKMFEDMATLWNHNLLNLAPPMDRTYGPDMTTYLSVLGLYQWCVLGKENAGIPPKVFSSLHQDDWGIAPLVGLTCPIVKRYVSEQLVSSHLKFPGKHFEQRNVRSGTFNLTTRPTSTYVRPIKSFFQLDEWVNIGSESLAETVHTRGEQFVPAMIQWASEPNLVSWIWWTQTANTLDSVVYPNGTLKMSYPDPTMEGTDKFIFATGSLPFDKKGNATWKGFENLPNLPIKVTTVGVEEQPSYFSQETLMEYQYWNTTYTVLSEFDGTPSITFELVGDVLDPKDI